MTMFTHIWKKEIRGELYTWKSMLWLVIASLLFSFTSYLLLTNQELSLLDQTELLWLLGKIVIGVALLIVTIDASSILNVEFEKETAESLFLSPISVKDLILGKLFASLTLWAAIFVISIPYIVVTSAGSHLAWAFIGYVALLGTLGITGLVFLIFGISLLYRSSKNTITTSLIILLALATPALFTSTLKNDIVSQTFSIINPIDNIFNSLDNVLVDYKTSLFENWQFLLPLIIFCGIAFLFLFFSAKRFEKQGIIKND
jgi:ABC-type transport system involved in multi-copper enzyme maturation permease subunit